MHNMLCDMNRLRKKSNNPNITERYNNFNKEYKIAKQKYLKQKNNARIENSSNIMKESWRIINENKNLNDKNLSNVIKTANNENLPTDDKANSINEYFINKNHRNNTIPNYCMNINKFHMSFFLSPTTPIEVISIIKLHQNQRKELMI